MKSRTLKEIKEEIRKFSEGAFGKRKDATGPLNHLKREIDELLDVLGKGGWEEEEEWADCLLLLLDAWRIRYGNWISYDKFIEMADKKLEIAKKREWDKTPDDEGVYSHKGKEKSFDQEILEPYKLQIHNILQNFIWSMNTPAVRANIANQISQLMELEFKDITNKDMEGLGLMEFEAEVGDRKISFKTTYDPNY